MFLNIKEFYNIAIQYNINEDSFIFLVKYFVVNLLARFFMELPDYSVVDTFSRYHLYNVFDCIIDLNSPYLNFSAHLLAFYMLK